MHSAPSRNGFMGASATFPDHAEDQQGDAENRRQLSGYGEIEVWEEHMAHQERVVQRQTHEAEPTPQQELDSCGGVRAKEQYCTSRARQCAQDVYVRGHLDRPPREASNAVVR